MTAEEMAIQDIKHELLQHSKCFLAFQETLNPIMDELVENYTETQNNKPMQKADFKVGDVIVPKEYCRGVEEATVTKVDNNNYYLKIMCGKAIIPISAQVNYKLKPQC